MQRQARPVMLSTTAGRIQRQTCAQRIIFRLTHCSYLPQTARRSANVINLIITSTLLSSSSPKSARFFTTSLLLASMGRDNDNSNFPVQKTEDEWRAVLSPTQFQVLRQRGTERPFTGEYEYHHDKGVYNCAGCNVPLYESKTKFDSGCGWPAFYEAVPGAIKRIEDRSFGMVRTEMVCSNCGGHLGHIFIGEGYKTPTDERHCVNSISLRFKAG
ncbi:Mss4-like protein [Lipomyces japonicus]|uniref:Mss4-like protein n=1 Tax=Lipomyces japonicus TaxID=56871 RepID=UPI0034CDB0DD